MKIQKLKKVVYQVIIVKEQRKRTTVEEDLGLVRGMAITSMVSKY